MSQYVFAMDVGGTFLDAVAMDETGRVTTRSSTEHGYLYHTTVASRRLVYTMREIGHLFHGQ